MQTGDWGSDAEPGIFVAGMKFGVARLDALVNFCMLLYIAIEATGLFGAADFGAFFFGRASQGLPCSSITR